MARVYGVRRPSPLIGPTALLTRQAESLGRRKLSRCPQGLAGLEGQLGDDGEIGAGVRLAPALLPPLEGRQRDAIGAGEGLLGQAQWSEDF